LKIGMEYQFNYQVLIMRIRILYMRHLASSYSIMLGRAIIVVCLLMDRQGLVKVIQWLDMARIEESYQFHAMKYSKELIRLRMKIKSIKFSFLC